MKQKIPLFGQLLLGLLVATALTFGPAEVLRGSGEVRSECVDCHLEANPDEFCSGAECCDAAGSICLEPDGQCLCA